MDPSPRRADGSVRQMAVRRRVLTGAESAESTLVAYRERRPPGEEDPLELECRLHWREYRSGHWAEEPANAVRQDRFHGQKLHGCAERTNRSLMRSLV